MPTVNDVRGNYVIREALESQSARLFAEKASSAEKEEVRRMAEAVDAMHAELVDELSAGDPERADRVMRQHVRHGMDEVLRRIERFLSGEITATRTASSK